jgi:HEAT repeat protein
MIRLTLTRSLLCVLVVPALVAAQQPPAQPAPRAKEPPRQIRIDPFIHIEPMLAIEPLMAIEPMLSIDLPPFHLEMPDVDFQIAQPEIDFHLPQMEWQIAELSERSAEIAAQAQEAAALATEQIGLRAGMFAEQAEAAAQDALIAWDRDGAAGLSGRPRAPWAGEDPADSLYRVAREALNRGEYRRAAQLFNELTRKFPRSTYAESSRYWEAFARYRAGTTDDLREAIKILETGGAQFASLRSDGNVDVPALRARIQAALAARGDANAARQLERDAEQNNGCDREEVSVRAEALSALGQMDFATALPTVKRVLARRDECTVELRRRALYILGRNPTNDAIPVMLDVARNDPESSIRGDAMSWLSRVGGDQAIPLLDELLRSSSDERTQRQAVSALGHIDTDNSRRAIRALIERADAADRVRCEAIASLARERDGRTVSSEEQAYLRSVYGKVQNDRLRECALLAVARVGGAENQQFLLALARNQNEPSAMRAIALRRLRRMTELTVDDIAGLYAVADSRSMREAILGALYLRKEPEAVDKMMDIARKDTDPQIRRYAISLLLKRKDPRATKLLQEMIDNERP